MSSAPDCAFFIYSKLTFSLATYIVLGVQIIYAGYSLFKLLTICWLVNRMTFRLCFEPQKILNNFYAILQFLLTLFRASCDIFKRYNCKLNYGCGNITFRRVLTSEVVDCISRMTFKLYFNMFSYFPLLILYR